MLYKQIEAEMQQKKNQPSQKRRNETEKRNFEPEYLDGFLVSQKMLNDPQNALLTPMGSKNTSKTSKKNLIVYSPMHGKPPNQKTEMHSSLTPLGVPQNVQSSTQTPNQGSFKRAGGNFSTFQPQQIRLVGKPEHSTAQSRSRLTGFNIDQISQITNNIDLQNYEIDNQTISLKELATNQSYIRNKSPIHDGQVFIPLNTQISASPRRTRNDEELRSPPRTIQQSQFQQRAKKSVTENAEVKSQMSSKYTASVKLPAAEILKDGTNDFIEHTDNLPTLHEAPTHDELTREHNSPQRTSDGKRGLVTLNYGNVGLHYIERPQQVVQVPKGNKLTRNNSKKSKIKKINTNHDVLHMQGIGNKINSETKNTPQLRSPSNGPFRTRLTIIGTESSPKLTPAEFHQNQQIKQKSKKRVGSGMSAVESSYYPHNQNKSKNNGDPNEVDKIPATSPNGFSRMESKETLRQQSPRPGGQKGEASPRQERTVDQRYADESQGSAGINFDQYSVSPNSFVQGMKDIGNATRETFNQASAIQSPPAAEIRDSATIPDGHQDESENEHVSKSRSTNDYQMKFLHGQNQLSRLTGQQVIDTNTSSNTNTTLSNLNNYKFSLQMPMLVGVNEELVHQEASRESTHEELHRSERQMKVLSQDSSQPRSASYQMNQKLSPMSNQQTLDTPKQIPIYNANIIPADYSQFQHQADLLRKEQGGNVNMEGLAGPPDVKGFQDYNNSNMYKLNFRSQRDSQEFIKQLQTKVLKIGVDPEMYNEYSSKSTIHERHKSISKKKQKSKEHSTTKKQKDEKQPKIVKPGKLHLHASQSVESQLGSWKDRQEIHAHGLRVSLSQHSSVSFGGGPEMLVLSQTQASQVSQKSLLKQGHNKKEVTNPSSQVKKLVNHKQGEVQEIKDEASPDKIEKVDLLVEINTVGTNEAHEGPEYGLLMPLKQKEITIPELQPQITLTTSPDQPATTRGVRTPILLTNASEGNLNEQSHGDLSIQNQPQVLHRIDSKKDGMEQQSLRQLQLEQYLDQQFAQGVNSRLTLNLSPGGKSQQSPKTPTPKFSAEAPKKSIYKIAELFNDGLKVQGKQRVKDIKSQIAKIEEFRLIQQHDKFRRESKLKHLAKATSAKRQMQDYVEKVLRQQRSKSVIETDPLGSRPPKVFHESSQIDILPQKHPVGSVPIYVMREVSRQPSQQSLQKEVKRMKKKISQSIQRLRPSESKSAISEEDELRVNYDSSVERTADDPKADRTNDDQELSEVNEENTQVSNTADKQYQRRMKLSIQRTAKKSKETSRLKEKTQPAEEQKQQNTYINIEDVGEREEPPEDQLIEIIHTDANEYKTPNRGGIQTEVRNTDIMQSLSHQQLSQVIQRERPHANSISLTGQTVSLRVRSRPTSKTDANSSRSKSKVGTPPRGNRETVKILQVTTQQQEMSPSPSSKNARSPKVPDTSYMPDYQIVERSQEFSLDTKEDDITPMQHVKIHPNLNDDLDFDHQSEIMDLHNEVSNDLRKSQSSIQSETSNIRVPAQRRKTEGLRKQPSRTDTSVKQKSHQPSLVSKSPSMASPMKALEARLKRSNAFPENIATLSLLPLISSYSTINGPQSPVYQIKQEKRAQAGSHMSNILRLKRAQDTNQDLIESNVVQPSPRLATHAIQGFQTLDPTRPINRPTKSFLTKQIELRASRENAASHKNLDKIRNSSVVLDGGIIKGSGNLVSSTGQQKNVFSIKLNTPTPTKQRIEQLAKQSVSQSAQYSQRQSSKLTRLQSRIMSTDQNSIQIQTDDMSVHNSLQNNDYGSNYAFDSKRGSLPLINHKSNYEQIDVGLSHSNRQQRFLNKAPRSNRNGSMLRHLEAHTSRNQSQIDILKVLKDQHNHFKIKSKRNNLRAHSVLNDYPRNPGPREHSRNGATSASQYQTQDGNLPNILLNQGTLTPSGLPSIGAITPLQKQIFEQEHKQNLIRRRKRTTKSEI